MEPRLNGQAAEKRRRLTNITKERPMTARNSDPDNKTPVYPEALLEAFAADITLAAYGVALQTGTRGTWLDLQLGDASLRAQRRLNRCKPRAKRNLHCARSLFDNLKKIFAVVPP